MILINDVLKIHELSIRDFGGINGIRDNGLLESAISRPFQTFAGEDLYPSVLEKVAAVTESLIINHPFVDGNKRTGTLVMLALLAEYKIRCTAFPDDLYDFIISISTGEKKFDQIIEWLAVNTSAD